MERKLEQEITGACILRVTIAHNGYGGGDSGHGGFTHFTLEDLGSTDIGISFTDENKESKKIDKVRKVSILFGGDSERDCFIEALKIVIKELEENRG